MIHSLFMFVREILINGDGIFPCNYDPRLGDFLNNEKYIIHKYIIKNWKFSIKRKRTREKDTLLYETQR